MQTRYTLNECRTLPRFFIAFAFVGNYALLLNILALVLISGRCRLLLWTRLARLRHYWARIIVATGHVCLRLDLIDYEELSVSFSSSQWVLCHSCLAGLLKGHQRLQPSPAARR